MAPELITFFAGMTPLLDVKLAIPLGKSLGLSSTSTLLFSIAGALLFPAILLAILDPTIKFLKKRSKTIHTFCTKILEKTRHEHSKKFNRFGAIFLIALVAIPIPGSGAGTGALVAYLFGVDYWKGFTLIMIGIIFSSLLIDGGIESVTAIINHFA